MFGIVGILVVGYVAKTMLAGQEKPAAPALRDIPAAVADLSPGTVITENHLGMVKVPREKLETNVLLANRVILGRVVKEPIKSGMPIKANQLYQPGELPPLDVAEGMRAVSVEVGDGVAMVDGMIKPGQYVDILFTAQGGGAGVNDASFQGGLTMRLFEGVKILAINRNYTQSRVDRGNNHVTLELTEAQANIVVLARDRGKLTLTYNPSNAVGDGGLALSNTERVTLYEILGLKKQDPAKDPFQTEIYRGNSRMTNQFDEKGRFVGGGNGSGYGYSGWNTGGYLGGTMGGVYGNGNGGQYALPNDATNNGAPQNNGRYNVPTPGINQTAPQQQPQGQPNNNPGTPRVPTASLPLPLQN
ncbi:MAG: Flp pilus assembly protein CpaB [Planctomycetota bacterium]